MNKEELCIKLKNVYNKLTDFKQSNGGYSDDAVLDVLEMADKMNDEKSYLDILQDNSIDKTVRVMSFYVLCTNYRRNKRYDDFEKLIEEYKSVFENEAVYDIQNAYYLSSSSKPSTRNRNLKEAYELWNKIEKKYPEYFLMPAFIQIYTETIALCFENKVKITDSSNSIELINKAISLLNMANKIREYPKFYATIGRLQLQLGLYDEAMDNYHEAMSKEDRNRSDCSIRMSDYTLALHEIERLKEENKGKDINFTLYDVKNPKPEAYIGEKPYIFFSYSHNDELLALKIISRLQTEGFRVWYDRGIAPGSDWAETIALHLNDCECFICLISSSYINSQNCLDEIHYIIDRFCQSGNSVRNYLPLYVNNITLKNGLKLRLGRQQALFINYENDENDFYRALFEVPMLQRTKE